MLTKVTIAKKIAVSEQQGLGGNQPHRWRHHRREVGGETCLRTPDPRELT